MIPMKIDLLANEIVAEFRRLKYKKWEQTHNNGEITITLTANVENKNKEGNK